MCVVEGGVRGSAMFSRGSSARRRGFVFLGAEFEAVFLKHDAPRVGFYADR